MEHLQFSNQVPEPMLSGSSWSPKFGDGDNSGHDPIESVVDDDNGGKSLVDSMLYDSNSKLVPFGFSRSSCTDEVFMFVNCGNGTSVKTDSTLKFVSDSCFEGGTVLRTDEDIADAGDFPFIYKSARFGNFCYKFHGLPLGDYLVDLHFAEIINTSGPRGIRVFDVFIQEDKVLSEFDIFSVVGANKPLQLVDVRVSVKEDGILVLRFEGLHGSPMVNAICMRKAPAMTAHQPKEYLRCNHCASEFEVSSAQKRFLRAKATDKYEKRIQELTTDCQRKTNECHEAWMSLTAANEQLEKVRMELDNKTCLSWSLDQTVGKQAEELRNITTMYGRDKMSWSQAINNMQEKIKIMKEEHIRLSHDAHGCIDSIPELNKMVAGVQALVAQCEDLKLKYSEEQAKRKQLYNQIQETKGNIRVFCRCRPLSAEEASTGYATVVDFDAAKDGDLGILTGGSNKKNFKFDRVYTPRDGQVNVFADASPMVVSVLDGYNVCIFAYGQTGTGKTFTMEGTEHNRGVNYRTLEQLFTVARERSDTFAYNISVSVLEVYNEQIRDLLTTSPTSKKLEIKQTPEGSHHVPGVVEAKVDNIKDVWSVLQAGSNARAVGSNNVNEHSSRSHCMLCIMVKTKDLMTGECTKSNLWLVDLAGSERIAKTDAQGERLKEAQNINKSLSALGDVIHALATKSSHIPYRNSKLTQLLQDSLGGDSKTLMFVQISPSENDLSETLSSLNFATRVRGVELGPAKKQVDTSEIQRVKALLEKARQESRSKDESLRKLEENLQNLENKARGKDHAYKSQQERIRELEGQLEHKSSLYSQSEKHVSQLSERLKGREEICNELHQKVKELERHLKQREQSDSEAFRQKVKELEKKMNEQAQESESLSFTLQQKIKELESRLHKQDQNSEGLVLREKVRELEEKLRAQEQKLQNSNTIKELESRLHKQDQNSDQNSEALVLHEKVRELEEKLRAQEQKLQNSNTMDGIIKATTTIDDDQKTCAKDDVRMTDVEANILKSSNAINRPLTRGYMTAKSVGDEARKKRHSRNGETENKNMQACFNDYRGRKSDPPKIARVTRPPTPTTTKVVAGGTTGQGTLTHKRINRESTPHAIKDRDSKKKFWC